MTDALKPIYAGHQLRTTPRRVLGLSDEKAAATFRNNSWISTALRHFNVEVEAVSLPDDLRRSVEEAQRRQAKGNQSRRSD
jgi:hypothetical protein